jgi:hypothetical protein
LSGEVFRSCMARFYLHKIVDPKATPAQRRVSSAG